MRAALAKTVSDIHGLQNKICPEKGNASSLNVCVTDGTKMCALRWRNSPSEHPPSLYLSTKAGAVLDSKNATSLERSTPADSISCKTAKESDEQPSGVAGKLAHIIVASEPTTFIKADWKLIEKNHCVLVDEKMGLRVLPMEI